ncbi:uncharacterized protein LOC124932664 [Impatiens glandulifera]|uniref:uncharacterized protein LOC124932664 n=1 Tax=Impatiens glandulifera TaxID=253017 RepID=UPI001FB19133|nr:uncharacterized protein LOC124932664 [Impatiens glandulifera]
MSSLSNALLLPNNPAAVLSRSGSSSPLKKLQISTLKKKGFTVQAFYSERENNSSSFLNGFILGGIVAGTLGFVYAPQISKTLAGTDKKEIMRKLPNFIYDEEKALEKKRQVLADKIQQLNTSIDDLSVRLRTEDSPDEVEVLTNEEL